MLGKWKAIKERLAEGRMVKFLAKLDPLVHKEQEMSEQRNKTKWFDSIS